MSTNPTASIVSEVKAEPVKVLTPAELVAYVVAALAGFKGLAGEALRVALGNLIHECRTLCPSHLGTAEQRKALQPVFSSDKVKRKAQLKAFDSAKREAKSVSRILFQFARDNGLGEMTESFTASRTSTGAVILAQRNACKIARGKLESVRF